MHFFLKKKLSRTYYVCNYYVNRIIYKLYMYKCKGAKTTLNYLILNGL